MRTQVFFFFLPSLAKQEETQLSSDLLKEEHYESLKLSDPWNIAVIQNPNNIRLMWSIFILE